MAETTTALVQALGRRVRDPNNLAHSSTNVISLLNHVQRVINAATSAVKVTATLTPTSPNAFYSVIASLSSLIRPERVLFNNEDVLQSDWRSYNHIDPYWARAIGPKPLQWDRVGHEIFIVTPIPIGETISVTGPKVTTALTTAGQATELPDQHMPAMLAIMEQLLLQRQRLFTSVKPSVESMQRLLPAGIP